MPGGEVERVSLDGPLVIGAGLAGLSAALAAAPRPVLVVAAAPLAEGCASAWAQGGVAAAVGAGDSAALHAADTERAGAGLVEPEAALRLARAAPAVVARLLALGAPFDRDAEGRLIQSLEAAHSLPRVARVGGDRAGAAIMAALTEAALRSPALTLWAPARARALVRTEGGAIRGALVERGGRLVEILAPAVILATGGLGGLFAVTTNPPALRGEGLGLAALAGAAIADPEFVQFHPTALDIGLDPAPLATEALRGEGAVLVDRDGRAFMQGVHPQKDLAPRDVVARAVHAEIAAGRGAFLDARAAVGPRFPDLFPTVYAACRAAGLDPRLDPMPVAPAAHYHMGGIETSGPGRASLEGLWAAGECASAGVHGANRLASNSLLEAAGFGFEAGRDAAEAESPSSGALAPTRPFPDLPAEALAVLRPAMSRDAGVARDAAGLTRLIGVLDSLFARHGPAPALMAASLVAQAALARRESRGAHFRLDAEPDLGTGTPPRRTRLSLEPLSPAEAA